MKLTADEISNRWANLGSPIKSDSPSNIPEFELYEPLGDAVHSYVRWAQTPYERIFLGLPRIDDEMRGIANGEICMLVGYSHGGKTLLLLNSLEVNRDKYIVLFIPDEPKQLVLSKLTCMHHGINARELERLVAQNDPNAIELLRETAEDNFARLAVFDNPATPSDMEKSLNEVSNLWGRVPDLVVIDYLDLVASGETVPDKANFIKSFGRRHDIPMLVLHQTSRSSGADGAKLSISSGAYGGEQQATSILGVRRKKFSIMAEINEINEKLAKGHSESLMTKLDSLYYDARIHEYTITVSLLKNKRPGGQLVDDMDYEIDLASGKMIPLMNGDLPKQYLNGVRGLHGNF